MVAVASSVGISFGILHDLPLMTDEIPKYDASRRFSKLTKV